MKYNQRRARVMAHISHQSASLGINPKDYLQASTTEELSILNIAEKHATRVNLARQETYDAMVAYARENAGVTDLDPELQEAGLEAIQDGDHHA